MKRRESTSNHIKECPSANIKSEYCEIEGHLEKCCNQIFPQRKKGLIKLQNRRWPTKVRYVSQDFEELEEDDMVLHLKVAGTGLKALNAETIFKQSPIQDRCLHLRN